MNRVILALAGVMSFATPFVLCAQVRGGAVSEPRGDDVRRVLLIGAHPDDEDTNLISWLQRGGRAETAYLSLTRGDGGQNLIGNELGEQLGIIRTEELLAARRVDGAHQFFTRAYDFGYSKSAEETYAHWPKDSLLNDVVTVVRSWRPHVIIGVFSGTPRDGHGQHQVSGMLAKEAYEAAGDTLRFPVLDFGPQWVPLKFYRAARFSPDAATLRMNVGEYNADLGRSYAEIAGESRSQHKSQGFGALERKGVLWDYVRREATRVNDGAPAASEESIFDGLTASSPGAVTVSPYAAIAPHIALEAMADRRHLALGDSARVVATLYNRSRETVYVVPQSQGNLRLAITSAVTGDVTAVAPDSAYRWELYMQGAQISQPWWLTSPRNGDLFAPPLARAESAGAWRNTPEDERGKKDWVSVLVSTSKSKPGTSALVKASPVVFRFVDPVRGDVQRPISVTPAVSISLDRPHELARANTHLDRFFNVTLRSAAMSALTVTVSLQLPSGLTADSAARTVTLDSTGTRTVSFRVRGRLAPGLHDVSARALTRGATYVSGYVPIEYDHITPQRIYRPATVSLHAVDVRVPPGTTIGYIQGVGDNVAPALTQLGIPVTLIEPKAIPTVDLSKFSAVVVGPRAYDASRELMYNNGYLLDYARGGGTLVVQYGQYEMMRPGVMPYSIAINRPHDRVAEEVAAVTILDAASPALRQPNIIAAADFVGWVQERGLYMPRTFDAKYRPVLAVNDPGETPNRGGILVTPYGKGLYVYTTLSFFRQLPAGVSGATKLFVNLVSMNNGRRTVAAGAGQR